MLTTGISSQGGVLLHQQLQGRHGRRTLWIKGAAIGCALVAILASTQYLMNTQIDVIDCSETPDYYRVARWWSSSASYCLAEEQIKLLNASPEAFEGARKLLIEAAKWGLHAAITKLSDCSLYPTTPSQEEMDLIKRVAFPENRAAVLPWSVKVQERCFRGNKERVLRKSDDDLSNQRPLK